MPQYTRILALGDSETFGARAKWGRTYPAQLEDLLAQVHTGVPAICINAGVNGETTWQIVDRGQRHLLDDPWIKVVLCMAGTNCVKPANRTPVEHYLEQWDRLLRVCRCTDTLLYALEMHAIDPVGQPEYDAKSIVHMETLNAALKDWCTENRVPFIDGLFKLFKDNPLLLADGIHPTNEGNKLIAEHVFEVLGKPLPYPED